MKPKHPTLSAVVRAHILTNDEFLEMSTTSVVEAMHDLYTGSEYTHVDVYSPLSSGQHLLWRVKL